MRRTFWLLLVTLALPVAALGSSVDFTNDGGMLNGSSAGLGLTGSTLIAVNGLNGMGLVTGNLGSVTLTTLALTAEASQRVGLLLLADRLLSRETAQTASRTQ